MSSDSIMNKLDELLAGLQENYSRFKETPSQLELDLIREKLRKVYDLTGKIEPDGMQNAERRMQNAELKTENQPPTTVILSEAEGHQPPTTDHVEEPAEVEMPAEVEEHTEDGTILAEKFMNGDDRTLAEKINKTVIQDLKTSIRLNDKFVFIKELFNNNVLEYNEAVDQLNSAGSMDKAEEKLLGMKEKYQWTIDMEPFLRFTGYIDKKYS